MSSTAMPIAVIGMGCRLPGGVNSPEDLWSLLSEGRSGLSKVPANRWNADAFYHPDPGAKEALNTKKGYFLTQDVSRFDARFFGFTANEADQTDPQQRLMLEVAYEAFENAGIPLESLRGSDTSVYVSVFARDYDRMTYKDLPSIQNHAITGNGEAILAARLSYVFDLRGGAMTIDTGCSGSMVAVHQACLALQTGESRVAIAGGTQLLLHPDQFVPWSYNGMANPEGQSFAFDSRGSGYGRGEGLGAVVLKRLDHALADGDSIHAIIRGSGINQDGKTNGILLPNGLSQRALVQSVYEKAGLDPSQTLFFEAHGTGTVAGDRAEIESITAAMEPSRRARELFVGSVKANLGHLEASSGIAGFIKAVMVLRKGQIPPQVNFIQEKPGLNLAERGIKIPVELTPLVPADHVGPRRVSVNSYGYGGTNAHVILELPENATVLADGNAGLSNGHFGVNDTNAVNGINQANGGNGANGMNGVNGINGVNGTNGVHATDNVTATAHETDLSPLSSPQATVNGTSTAAETPLLFPITAHSDEALKAIPETLAKWLSAAERSHDDLQSLSYTLSCRRSTFRWRNVLVAKSVEDLREKLLESPGKTRAASTSNVAFVFTGQGAQWYAMGRELLTGSALFNKSITAIDDYLKELGCQWSLVEEIGSRAEADTRTGSADVAQPATTAIQIALVDVLASLGIRPRWVVGHSSGEIAAAYAAGKLDFKSAMRVSYLRGQHSVRAKSANAQPGAMMAVAGNAQTLQPMIKSASTTSGGQMRIACVNSPESITVSGDEVAIDALSQQLKHTGIFARKLKVDTAYHSHHMEAIAGAYRDSISDVQPISGGTANVQFFSSVTGELKTDEDFGGSYWTQNLVSRVLFNDAVQALARDMSTHVGSSARDCANIFVEIGPHAALQGPLRQALAQVENLQYSYAPSLVRNKDACVTVLSAAARLFELGHAVDLRRVVEMSNSRGTAQLKVVQDLDPYQWDHRQGYWRESRLSRDSRLRKFGYHDLLGLRDPASPLNEPRWRYHLSTERLPWLTHHVVEDQVIWPGTGYMCMAIEAMKQLSQVRQPDSRVASIVFKNAEVKTSVTVPVEPDSRHKTGVEVQLVLNADHSSDGSPWEAIRISSELPDGSWALNYTGFIRAELRSPAAAAALPEGDSTNTWISNGNFKEEDQALERLEIIQALSQTQMDPAALYADLKNAGNQFGASFTLLESIHTGDRVGYATMRVPDLASFMPKGHLEPHTVHPTVLDIPNHLLGALFYQVCCKAAVMPTTTSEFRIFTDGTEVRPGDELLIACEITPQGPRAAKGNTWLFQQPLEAGGAPRLLCATTEIKLQAIGSSSSDGSDEETFARRMVTRTAWGDHIDLMSDDAYQKVMSTAFKIPEGRLGISSQLKLTDQAAAVILERAPIKDIVPPADAEPHLHRLREWIDDFMDSDLHKSLLEDVPSEADKDGILETSLMPAAGGATGQMLARIGKHLPDILAGKVHALGIMVEDDLLNRFYMDGPLEASNAQSAKYITDLAHVQPHMSILEIGAGTGSATLSILEGLTPHGDLLLEKYTYTDLSAGFFENAAIKFAKWAPALEFKVLDASKNPNDQGFEDGSYDLIVASNVIHATPNISETLANVRRLLRPGGRFVLLELTRETVAMGMTFGTLSGWWASEDGRKGSPIMSRDAWNSALTEAGFNGIERASYDEDGPWARTSVIISKAIEAPAPPLTQAKGSVTLVTTTALNGVKPFPPLTTSLSQAVASALESKGLVCVLGGRDALSPPAGFEREQHTLVVLDDANNALLADPSSDAFEAFREIVSAGPQLLWVGYHGATEKTDEYLSASNALAVGAGRTLRRENEGMSFMTLDIQNELDTHDSVSEAARAVCDLVERSYYSARAEDKVDDFEFCLRDGRLMVPRLHTDSEFFEWADARGSRRKLVTAPFIRSDEHPLKLEVQVPGLLSSLCFVHDPAPPRRLEPDEVQVEARAYGVNFRDVFIALGQLPPTSPMAGEVAGIITAVGAGDFASSNFQVGDRVIGLLGAPYASHNRLKAMHCHKLPDSMSFSEGASLYTVFQTVYYSLTEVARLEQGQSILIHSASGGVGQAAIQLAQHMGAEIFATVGSEAKKTLVAETYGLPESHILSSRWAPREIRRQVMRLTGDRGVDVVVNSMAGEMLSESWDCLAPLGVHIELGKADIYKNNHLPMAPFDQSRTFAAVDLTVLLTQIPLKMFKILGKVLDLFTSGTLKPVYPLTVMPIGDIEAAFRMVAERRHIGKVVLECNRETTVTTQPRPPTPLWLEQEGVYLIAGGLGDLGQRMARVLATLGAGHIVTLSRRDLEPEARSKLEAEIGELGGRLHIVKCDVTSTESIESAKKVIMPLGPVRGIIQGAMVLRDRPLDKMHVDDWNLVLGPKVRGTMNLDNAFASKDLSFYISLSSLSGVLGRMAQSSYAAANCFMDTYMIQRNASSPDTSYFTINVGAVVGSESINNMTATLAQRELLSQGSISFKELFEVLQYAMDPRTAFEGRAQATMGVDRLSLLSNDHVAAANPMFSMLPHVDDATDGEAGSKAAAIKRDPKLALSSATTYEAAVAVVSEAVTAKLVTFTSRDLEDIDMHAPMVAFGLDSLVSIELKNWMMRSFGVTVQVSELVGSSSILELSATLVGRSTLVKEDILKTKEQPNSDSEETKPSNDSESRNEPMSSSTETPSAPAHGLSCCRQFKELPKQPVPDIDEALEEHIQNVAHFAADEEELEEYCSAVRELAAPGGMGRRIFDDIVKTAEDPNVENWISDYLLKAIHLDWRHGVPFSSFMMLQHEPVSGSHSQADRAAIIATAAFEYKTKIESGETAAEWQFAGAQCKHLEPWLFNATREPAKGSDVSRMYSGDYFVVLRRGRLFKIPYRGSDDALISLNGLKHIIEDILDLVRDEGSWAGILTTDNRDSWSEKRQELLALDPQNVGYFSTIDAALTVINLDESEPQTLLERISANMQNEGFNRWWDKPLQFIVNGNGRSGVILEHSHIDGVTALPLLYHLNNAIQTYTPLVNGVNGVNGVHGVETLPQEYGLITTPAIDAHISDLRQNWSEILNQREFVSHAISDMGSKFLSSHGMPIKGVLELLIQLASQKYHGGKIVESWQGVSLSHFHKGRHDMIQTTSGPVAEFCAKASQEEGVSLSDCKQMMLRAAADINANMKTSIDGKGFFRLANVIKANWPADMEMARMFEHPIYRTIDRYSVIVTMLDPVTPGAAAMPGNPHAERVRYAVEDDGVTFGVIGPRGRVKAWEACFDWAAAVVRKIVLEG